MFHLSVHHILVNIHSKLSYLSQHYNLIWKKFCASLFPLIYWHSFKTHTNCVSHGKSFEKILQRDSQLLLLLLQYWPDPLQMQETCTKHAFLTFPFLDFFLVFFFWHLGDVQAFIFSHFLPFICFISLVWLAIWWFRDF